MRATIWGYMRAICNATAKKVRTRAAVGKVGAAVVVGGVVAPGAGGDGGGSGGKSAGGALFEPVQLTRDVLG